MVSMASVVRYACALRGRSGAGKFLSYLEPARPRQQELCAALVVTHLQELMVACMGPGA